MSDLLGPDVDSIPWDGRGPSPPTVIVTQAAEVTREVTREVAREVSLSARRQTRRAKAMTASPSICTAIAASRSPAMRLSSRIPERPRMRMRTPEKRIAR